MPGNTNPLSVRDPLGAGNAIGIGNALVGDGSDIDAPRAGTADTVSHGVTTGAGPGITSPGSATDATLRSATGTPGVKAGGVSTMSDASVDVRPGGGPNDASSGVRAAGGMTSGGVVDSRRSSIDWSSAIAETLRDFGQPALAAQPIADLTTGRIAGYELLARFAGSAIAPPNVWFGHADRLGLATELTARIIEHAFALRPQLPRGVFLAINIEPHLLSDPAVSHALRSVPSLDGIIVELTGHTPVRDERSLMSAVALVRQLGGLIAIDDAGTGYAGLRHLIVIHPDIVKVDRDLVSGIDTDPIRRTTVELLGDLASRTNAKLLAEGVETEAELRELIALGVPMAQGWALARPGWPWPRLESSAIDQIHESATHADTSNQVSSLVRECVTADRAAWCASNAAPPGRARPTMIVVDGDGRAMGVVATEARGARYLAPVMAVPASTSPIDAARRAMARAVCHRGVPLVCVDGEGKPAGVIDVAELLDAAITTAHRQPASEDRAGATSTE